MMASTMLPAKPLSPTGRLNVCCNRGDNDDKPEEAVDHRRNAAQQLDDGLQHVAHTRVGTSDI